MTNVFPVLLLRKKMFVNNICHHKYHNLQGPVLTLHYLNAWNRLGLRKVQNHGVGVCMIKKKTKRQINKCNSKSSDSTAPLSYLKSYEILSEHMSAKENHPENFEKVQVF